VTPASKPMIQVNESFAGCGEDRALPSKRLNALLG
jgi:hypothetical protein